MKQDLQELRLALRRVDESSRIDFLEDGNSWLPVPFLAISKSDGFRFALYFREESLFFVPVRNGTVQPAIIVSDQMDTNAESLVLEIQRLERQLRTLGQTQQPSFLNEHNSAKKTSEPLQNFKLNWLLPLFSGAVLFLLVLVFSIGSANNPQLGTVSYPDHPSPPGVETTLEPIPLAPATKPKDDRQPLVVDGFDGQLGSMVICKDGTVSYAGGKQGACSWHGGVR